MATASCQSSGHIECHRAARVGREIECRSHRRLGDLPYASRNISHDPNLIAAVKVAHRSAKRGGGLSDLPP
jgi:hypothetical protein